jgi:iron complex transport system ATP-binding protein
MVSLSGRGLVFDYPGGLRALAGVDLELSGEDVVVICGPNGSGKSTLLNLLAGLLVPSAGDVALDGRPLPSIDLRERAQLVARVPQQLRTMPDVTVGNFVMAGRYARIERWAGPSAKDHRAVELSLLAADAEAWTRRPMGELSGGERQRVLIARALAQEASVLLIDEPTNALDPEHQLKVFDMIAGLGRHGRAALVVTHDLNLASQFATSIILLDRGRVVARGSSQEVLRPEVLRPVYGEHLHFGKLPDGRPFVLPWMGRDETGADPLAQ